MNGLLLALLLSQPSALEAFLRRDAVFFPRERAVSGWRIEAALHLDTPPGTRAALLLGRDPTAVGRCVRLNNYWCIKRGGWSGEIAADADGHVAFASALEGATTAALLLRRYYVDDGRRTALTIVSRWAPASCGAHPRTARRAAPDGFSRSGLGLTLRARWLARHGRHAAGRGRVSAVPDRLIGSSLPAPAIALGLGTVPPTPTARSPDTFFDARAASPPVPACAGEERRIADYAARAAAGIAPSATADLALFDREGSPTPHLARLLRNMAGVEIGPLGAGTELVDAAIARAAATVAARRTRLPEPRS